MWNALVPDASYLVPSKRWTELGFQNTDPRTDFRDGGELALRCLVYLAETDSDAFFRYIEARRYPVSVVGVNLTLMLAEIFTLSAEGPWEPRAFWHLFENPRTFYASFVIAFASFDRKWTEKDATLERFGEVLRATRDGIIRVADQGPGSLGDFRTGVLKP